MPLDTFMARTPSPRDDPAVLNADDAVSELGDLLVVGDHHHGLVKLLAGDPQQTQHILAGPAVQVPCRYCNFSMYI